MTGTPIENRLGELWAIMDLVNPGLLGSREWFDRTFAKPVEVRGDERALERLRSIVQPFVLRREKDAPEVELELPPITIEKDYCRLTVEQASLYRATVDRWLPRIEAHGDRFGRRGAVLAMLSHLKQVCNHPELLVATGQPLDGRSGKLERLVSAPGARCPKATSRSSSRSTPASTASCRTWRSGSGRASASSTDGSPPGSARSCWRRSSGGRAVGARDLDPRRRPRPQPARGEPRLPLRSLVEPGGRAAGDRPRAPLRPAQARLRAQPHLLRHPRGADRRAARLEARARREGDRRPLRGLARRPRPRRHPRRRRPCARSTEVAA